MAEERRERQRVPKSHVPDEGFSVGRGASRGRYDLRGHRHLDLLKPTSEAQRQQLLQKWYKKWQSKTTKTAPSDWQRFFQSLVDQARAEIEEWKRRAPGEYNEQQNALAAWAQTNQKFLEQLKAASRPAKTRQATQGSPKQVQTASSATPASPAAAQQEQTLRNLLEQNKPTPSPPEQSQSTPSVTGVPSMANEPKKPQPAATGKSQALDPTTKQRIAGALQSPQKRHAAITRADILLGITDKQIIQLPRQAKALSEFWALQDQEPVAILSLYQTGQKGKTTTWHGTLRGGPQYQSIVLPLNRQQLSDILTTLPAAQEPAQAPKMAEKIRSILQAHAPVAQSAAAVAAPSAGPSAARPAQPASPPPAQPTQPATQVIPPAAGAEAPVQPASASTGPQPATQQPVTAGTLSQAAPKGAKTAAKPAPSGSTKASRQQAAQAGTGPQTPLGTRPGPSYGKRLRVGTPLSQPSSGAAQAGTGQTPSQSAPPVDPAAAKPVAPLGVPTEPTAPPAGKAPTTAPAQPGPAGRGWFGKAAPWLAAGGVIAPLLYYWLSADQSPQPTQPLPLPPQEDSQLELAKQAALQQLYENLLRTGSLYFPPPPYTLSGFPDMYPPANAAPGWPGLYPPLEYGPSPPPQFFAPQLELENVAP